MSENPNFIYCADWQRVQPDMQPERPLNIVFLTSIRDVGADDQNGRMVETEHGSRYMEGIIERTVRETYPGRSLSGLFRIVGVITDDTAADMADSSYGNLPGVGRDWIHPFNLTTPDGNLVRDRTYNLPSFFRSISSRTSPGEKRQAKWELERQIYGKMEELGADILVSDHYMARIDYLMGEFGLFGRILNIHPAVTVKDHPFAFPGKTPTADAIQRARSGVLTRTGATLHIVNEEIDAGPAIAYGAETPVFPHDQPVPLRYRNYQEGKLPLFVAGMAHYARAIYPHLEGLDFANLEPRQQPQAFDEFSRREASL